MNRLRIGYQDIKIIKERSSMADSLGKYNTETAEIHIKINHSNREVLNTLLHEMMHAVWHTYGIRAVITDDDKHEYICNTTANALTQIFLDNKELLKWIGDNLDG